ncbi:MAG: hypothetical protein MK212_10010 [Saprospiraceae bacterium]|nr:hypothetical protein [Saprospiraceae bacterium]
MSEINKVDREHWLQLATSEIEANRRLALELVPVVASQVQPELTFWFFFNQNFLVRKKIYDHLNQVSREKVDALISDITPSMVIQNKDFQEYLYDCISKHKGITYRRFDLIKHLRQTTNMPLAKAKKMIDAIFK